MTSAAVSRPVPTCRTPPMMVSPLAITSNSVAFNMALMPRRRNRGLTSPSSIRCPPTAPFQSRQWPSPRTVSLLPARV